MAKNIPKKRLMSVFLIDTDILIDISKNIKSTIDWFNQTLEEDSELAICPINITEFYSGLPPKDRPKWDNFFEPFNFWTITKNISRQAGIWRYEFSKKGITISTTDSLIAAIALVHNATLVTRNIKDYPLPGIKLFSLGSLK